MPHDLPWLRANAFTGDGLRAIVTAGVVERDHIEFKAFNAYHKLKREWKYELRKDCAALATTGEGFLIVGIAESEDGHDRAEKLEGVAHADARAFKDTWSHVLKDEIDPPFGPNELDIRIVPLDNTVSAVVVHVFGRPGYAKSVVKNAPLLVFVRRVNRDVVFDVPERVRHERAELDNNWWKHAAGYASVLALVFLASVIVVGVYAYSTASQLVEVRKQVEEATDNRASAVTNGKARAFIEALRAVPEKPPIELACLDEPGAIALGDVVVSMLNEAEWKPWRAQKQAFWFPTTNGVHIEVASMPPPTSAQAVADALGDLGIGPVSVLVPERLPEKGGFRIFVGRKTR